MGQKFKYTKLTLPFTAWKIPEIDVMALEASDKLCKLAKSIGGVPVDVFQGLASNSVPLCLTSWKNQKIIDLHKSGSSLGAISKCLKIPRSSVQPIVRKYKHHGTKQPSYRSRRRSILSPRDEHALVQKVQINPRTTAKYLVRC